MAQHLLQFTIHLTVSHPFSAHLSTISHHFQLKVILKLLTYNGGRRAVVQGVEEIDCECWGGSSGLHLSAVGNLVEVLMKSWVA